MATDSALAQLKDIHLPDPISWWPLAPGWYILIVLLLTLLLSGIYWVLHAYYHSRGKRQALQILERYQQEYLRQGNSQLAASRVSELLKRLALRYYPREHVASLQGQSWIDFLNQTSNKCDFNAVKHELTEIPYQSPRSCDLNLLFTVAKAWIKQRKGRCLN